MGKPLVNKELRAIAGYRKAICAESDVIRADISTSINGRAEDRDRT
jgi:hypothetical protein